MHHHTDKPSYLQKLTKAIYLAISCIILISGVIWCWMILVEVVDKGRMPIEADPRFIKGIKADIGLAAVFGMLYGSAFWIFLTAIILRNGEKIN